MDADNTNPWTAHKEPGTAWAFLSIHFTISVSVLIAGSIASINFLRCKPLRKPLTILYLHLFFVDSLSSMALVLALPKRLASRSLVISSQGYCQFEGFLVDVSTFCEISTLACIALERYLTVVAVDRGKGLKSIPLYVIIFTDVCIMSSALARALLGRSIQPVNTAFCRPNPVTVDSLDDALGLVDASIQVLSLGTIGFCYAQIAAKVWSVLSRARLEGLETKLGGTTSPPTVENSRALTREPQLSALITVPTPDHPCTSASAVAQVPKRPTSFLQVLHSSDLQRTFLSFVVAAIALTLWLPLAVLITMELFPEAPIPSFNLFSSFAVLTHFHTLVDCVIVTMMDAELRNEMPRALRWIGALFTPRWFKC